MHYLRRYPLQFHNWRTDCFLVVILGILALTVSQRSSEDKRSTKEFWWKDHKFYHYTGTFAWNCCLFINHARRLPTNFKKCQFLGSGKFELGQWKVREKSGNFTFYNLWEPCYWLSTLPVAALLRFFIDANLLFLKQSLQTHFVCSCRDTYVFYAMYWGLYGDIKSFLLLMFVWIKMANFAKY